MVFPLDEIVLRIPPGCDAMKSFCNAVSAWCSLISVTATWPIVVLYRWSDDDVSGWEWMIVPLQFGAHPMAIRCFQLPSLRPFPFVFFRSARVSLSDTYNKVVLLLILSRESVGWEQIMKKATYTATWSALGEMHLRPPVGPITSTLSGICLLCNLVFWYRRADTSMSTICP